MNALTSADYTDPQDPSTRCSATTTAGKPCRARPMESGGTCLAHTPGAHAAAVAKGGAATAELYRSMKHLKLETHEDCRAACERIVRDVLLGRITARTAQVAAGLIRTAQVSLDNAIEGRIAELEALVEAQQPQGVRRRR